MREFLRRLFRKRNPDLVPYHDIAANQTVWIPKSELCPGVVMVQIEGHKEPVYLDSDQLKRGEYQHPPFDDGIREMLASLVANLSDVYPLSLNEWEDGFRRDRNSEREIAGWIHLAGILTVMTKSFNFDPAKRMECFKVLVACLTGARETVVDRTEQRLLSSEELSQAIHYFYEGGYR